MKSINDIRRERLKRYAKRRVEKNYQKLQEMYAQASARLVKEHEQTKSGIFRMLRKQREEIITKTKAWE